MTDPPSPHTFSHVQGWVYGIICFLLEKYLFNRIANNNFIIYSQNLISNFEPSILDGNMEDFEWIYRKNSLPTTFWEWEEGRLTLAAAPCSVRLFMMTPLSVSSSLMAMPRPPWSWRSKNRNTQKTWNRLNLSKWKGMWPKLLNTVFLPKG